MILVGVVGRGGGGKDVRKCWKFLKHFKDNFLEKFKKYLVHVVGEYFRKRVYFGRSLKMVLKLGNVRGVYNKLVSLVYKS